MLLRSYSYCLIYALPFPELYHFFAGLYISAADTLHTNNTRINKTDAIRFTLNPPVNFLGIDNVITYMHNRKECRNLEAMYIIKRNYIYKPSSK